MPKFVYIVKDKSGKTYKNVIEAPTQNSIIEKLQSQNFFIISIKEIISATSPRQLIKSNSKQRKFSHKKVKLNDILSFSRQLATMLDAGVNLIRSLDVILTQIDSKELFEILTKVRSDVSQGNPLSKSISKYPKVFNQFWVSLLEVGEASGTIPAILNKLATYLEQQAAFRSTIVSGLIYPGILFTVSMGAIAFFALFVGPRFESIFNSMGVELPLITIILLATFKFVKTNILYLLGISGLAIFFIYKYSKTHQGKLFFEQILLKTPKIGEVLQNILVEKFSSQMSILIDSGVPILTSLDISERLVDNITCSIIIGKIKEAVKEGALLGEPMQRSGFFPPMAVQMIMVGEETGELSKMLKHVARFYQNAVEIFMSRFATIIEPFMLVFMGGIIGTIVVAMFLPMFNIAQLGGGGG
ncbi:MAG: type II secretion system F family protein [Candidatus Omnitrophica bacterium]|nr:type II secretion system F family protein [Candidatus Omnitrophota bacterium]MCB9748248.1 type II secretion system F family protein [Candidatus Omnitrophota bacterium]